MTGFAALRFPDFRLWFVGQAISLAGVWMQMTAQGYLLYEMTHAPEYLGYVAFAAGAPSLLLMPFGGVISDRMSRRGRRRTLRRMAASGQPGLAPTGIAFTDFPYTRTDVFPL
jgi:MFS family permease